MAEANLLVNMSFELIYTVRSNKIVFETREKWLHFFLFNRYIWLSWF